MAEIKKTVCPGGGCDYTSLEAALNDNEQDLTDAGGDNLVIEIQEGTGWSSPDTTLVVIDNYVTNVTNNILITTTAGARHDGSGSWNEDKYRLEVSPANFGVVMDVLDDNVITKGIQIALINNNNVTTLAWDGDGLTFAYSVLSGHLKTGTGSLPGLIVTPNAGGSKIYNNIFRDIANISCDSNSTSNGDIFVYCNTFVDNGTGLNTNNSDTVAKNNLAFGNTDDYGATFNAESTNNAFGEADGTGFSNSVNISAKAGTDVFVDYNNNDFHIKGTISELIGAGVDLDPDGDGHLNITDDIDGDARDATTPDIGADEFVAPVGDGTNIQINIGDVWKDVEGMQINIGDVWKTVEGAQINIGDTWKEIF